MKPSTKKRRNPAAAVGVATLFAASISILGAGSAVAAGPTTWYVDPSGSGSCDDSGEPCATISEAIDQASDGDTVEVSGGTYNEQVVIDKAITVSGAGAGASILSANGVPSGSGIGLLRIDGESVNGDITFEGFTVQDTGAVNVKNNTHQGIYTRVNGPDTGTATIRDSEFKLGDTSFDPDLIGPVGMLINQGGHVAVEGNTFNGFWQAILAENSGDLTVTNNTFTDLQPVVSNDWAPQGVYIIRYEDGPSPEFIISGNTFEGYAGQGVSLSSGYTDQEAACTSGCEIDVSATDNVLRLSESLSSAWKSAAISSISRDSGNTIALEASGNTGHVGGNSTPIETRDGEGEVATTNSTGEPNEIIPSDDGVTSDASIDVDLPSTIAAGDPASEFTGTATNDSASTTFPDVRYAVTIAGPGALGAGDVTLLYEDPAGSDPFSELTLTENGSGALSGYVGPEEGFPFPPGDHTGSLRIAFAAGAPSGMYTADFAIVQVNDNGDAVNVLANDTPEIEVTAAADWLAVTKTVDSSFVRIHDWDLAKTGEVDEITVGDGAASAAVDYTVTATPGDYRDDNYLLRGEITVTNQYVEPLGGVVVTDEADVGATASCTVVPQDSDLAEDFDPEEGITIPAEETVIYDYLCDLDGTPTDGENTATASWFSGDEQVSATEAVVFEEREANFDSVTVVDDQTTPNDGWADLGTADWNADGTPAEFTYTLTHEGLTVGECTTFTNTARINDTEQTTSADVEICPEASGGDTSGGSTPPGTPGLPSTGADVNAAMITSLLLLLVGGGALTMRRYQRS